MKTYFSKYEIFNKGFYLIMLFGILGTIMALGSCKKEDNNETTEMDEESVYNIELQEELAGTFNALLYSLDTIEAADSVLKLLLLDPHVISGEVFEQVVFVEYRDGTVGGIFFNPQDAPEMEFSFPGQLKSGSALSGANTTPASKLTILINPHYFQREAHTNLLLERYDELFPGIGYETPERYFNDACNLDLFTKLENYGFIHIYSHGVRVGDDIYLQTGESPNAGSHSTYSQSRQKGEVGGFTSAITKLTKYYILPEFIYDYNNFTDDKPLVYGGFCYSYLGLWPEMFESAGAAGYFGFDWAVRTSRSTNWAGNLIAYMTDYSVGEPYSSSWWMESSPIEKSYWAENHNRNVSINYKGKNDLVLWDWEGAGLNFTSFNLSIQLNAVIEDSDGNLSNEVWTLPLSPGLGHDITFTANSFTSSWHDELFFDRSRSGDIEITIRPDGKEIVNFSLNDTLYVPANTTFYTYNIQLGSVPFASEDESQTIFEITGPDACNCIESLAYRKDYLSNNVAGWEKISSYECLSADSKVFVVMRK